MSGYILSQDARADLEVILDHIAEDSIASALMVSERFLAVFRMLAEHPDIGHYRADLTSRAVRFFPVYSYMIVYAADTAPVEIARILGSAQDLESILG